MDWDKEEQVRLAKEVATKCHSIFNDKESREFVSLVKKMREAQTDKDILEMRLRFKIDQDEKISDEDNAEFATAMCNVVFYEDVVDEYLEKMEK
jgi:predicted oxidoreductase (fatty acid repression mutant protein)